MRMVIEMGKLTVEASGNDFDGLKADFGRQAAAMAQQARDTAAAYDDAAELLVGYSQYQRCRAYAEHVTGKHDDAHTVSFLCDYCALCEAAATTGEAGVLAGEDA